MVSVPINLAFIPLETYGVWLACTNILAWATVLDPGFGFLAQQKIAGSYGSADLRLAGRYIAAGVGLNLVVALIFSLASFLLIPCFGIILGSSFQNLPDRGEIIYASAVNAAAVFLSVGSFGLSHACYGLQSSFAIGSIYLISIVMGFSVQIFLVWSGSGPAGIAWGNLARGLAVFAGGVIYLLWRRRKDRISFRWDKLLFRELLRLSPFTFGARFFLLFAQNVQAVIAVRLVSPEAAVAYRSTFSPVEIAIQVANRPAVAVAPVISRWAGAGEIASQKPRIERFFLFSLWIGALCFSGILGLNEKFVALWVGAGLFAGHSTNLWFCLTVLLLAANSTLTNTCYALGAMRPTSLLQTLQAVISILVMGAGGYWFGLPGIAAGVAVGAIVSVAGCGRLLATGAPLREISWRFLLTEALRCLGAGTAAGVLTFYGFPQPAGWPAFAAQLFALLALFGLFLLVLSAAARRELAGWGTMIFRALISRGSALGSPRPG